MLLQHTQSVFSQIWLQLREETGKPARAHLKTFRRHVGTYPLIFVCLYTHTQFLSLKLSMCSFTLFHCPYQCGKKIHQIVAGWWYELWVDDMDWSKTCCLSKSWYRTPNAKGCAVVPIPAKRCAVITRKSWAVKFNTEFLCTEEGAKLGKYLVSNHPLESLEEL